MVRCLLALSLVLATAGAAPAAETANVTGFQASPFSGDIPGIATTAISDPMMPTVGLSFHFAANPYGYLYTDRYGRSGAEETITTRLVAEVLAEFAPIEYLDIGLAVPLVLNQTSGDTFSPSGFGDLSGFAMSDVRLVVRGTFLNEGAFRIGLQADVTLPTGNADMLASNFLGGGPVLLMDVHAGIFMASLNVGAYFREEATLPPFGTTLSHELLLALGGAVRPIPQLAIEGGGFVRTQLTTPFENNTTQFEGIVGIRYEPIPEIALAVGGGGGTPAFQGVGTAQARAYLEVRYMPAPVPDSDDDDISDDDDQCPGLPEDKDGFEDEDGCPDPDNDRDEILDADDKCPEAPEDKDGFEDEDGCPDPDNDGDGIEDGADKCPLKAGPAGGDGCPDTAKDSDGDGIDDSKDKCPNAAETKNGTDDDDGCPDFPGVSMQGDKLVLDKPIEFKRRKDDLPSSAYDGLRALAQMISANPDWKKVRIRVHTDSKGRKKKLVALSKKRAQGIQRFLVTEGVSFRKLSIEGVGPAEPIADNKTKAGRAKNNRVEFVVVR